MIFIFDTSSFVSFARYYLPFDSNQKIYWHIKGALEADRIILIDEVLKECRFVSKKIVVEKLEFLNEKEFLREKNFPLNTKDLIPSAPVRFYNMVDNNFPAICKQLGIRSINLPQYLAGCEDLEINMG